MGLYCIHVNKSWQISVLELDEALALTKKLLTGNVSLKTSNSRQKIIKKEHWIPYKRGFTGAHTLKVKRLEDLVSKIIEAGHTVIVNKKSVDMLAWIIRYSGWYPTELKNILAICAREGINIELVHNRLRPLPRIELKEFDYVECK